MQKGEKAERRKGKRREGERARGEKGGDSPTVRLQSALGDVREGSKGRGARGGERERGGREENRAFAPKIAP